MSIDLLRWSLVELTTALRARRVSAVELMEAVLARIDETHADLNAVVARRDRDALLAEARAAERAHRARRGAAARGHPARREGPRGRRAGWSPREGSLPFRERVADARLDAGGAPASAPARSSSARRTRRSSATPAITKNLRVRRHALAVEPRRARRAARAAARRRRSRRACCRSSPRATAAARSASRRASPARSA